jgi:hypothetical protein
MSYGPEDIAAFQRNRGLIVERARANYEAHRKADENEATREVYHVVVAGVRQMADAAPDAFRGVDLDAIVAYVMAKISLAA